MAYLNARDMFDGGGAGKSGDEFEGGPFSAILNALGVKPMGYRDRKAQSAFEAGKPMGTFGGQPEPRPSYVVPAGPPLGSQPGAPTAVTLGQGPRMPPVSPRREDYFPNVPQRSPHTAMLWQDALDQWDVPLAQSLGSMPDAPLTPAARREMLLRDFLRR